MLTFNKEAAYDTMFGFEDDTTSFDSVCSYSSAIVVVDPMSTGSHLTASLIDLGYNVICVWSDSSSDVAKSTIAKGTEQYCGVINFDFGNEMNIAVAQAIETIYSFGFEIASVMAGSEPGVELADRLSNRMNLRTNGEDLVEARRNKYIMGEAVREAGARAAKQLTSDTWTDIEKYIEENWDCDEFLSVVKPLDSAGSDDVFKCRNKGEVERAFNVIYGKTNSLGQVNKNVLFMEFLAGTEYVIDGVSRDGIHKTVAIWEYDKRSVNNANFVYHGMQPKCVDTPEMKEMVEYAHKVLDAVGIENGPSHMEVIVTPTGPCLVEVGARIHGGNGSWIPISESCFGTTMVEETINCYLHSERFDLLKPYPTELFHYGREVFLVCRKEGTVKSMETSYHFIRSLATHFSSNISIQNSDFVKKTIDIFTRAGSVQLLHSDRAQVERDYEIIRKMELLSNDALLPDLFQFIDNNTKPLYSENLKHYNKSNSYIPSTMKYNHMHARSYLGETFTSLSNSLSYGSTVFVGNIN